MTFWIYLWKIMLVAAMCLFAGMAVWVTIGGFFDIKRLFASLRESHEQQEQQEQQQEK